MKRLIGHKWVIGAAALVFVFAVAGVAVAANTTSGTTGTTATAGPGGGPGGPHDLDPAQMQQRRELRQQTRDAYLKLVRDKMSPADQAAFDKLIAQQKEQQTAVENAAKALRDTNQQIREMTAKTLGVTLPTTTTTQATGGTQG
jgi:hypothetical protein